MSEKDSDPHSLVKITEQSLSQVNPKPFSPQAFETLNSHISRYISELVDESVKVSRRQQADSVSTSHVEKASEYLVAGTGRRVARHVNTIGGIFLGTGLSTVLSLVADGSVSITGLVFSVSLSAIGAALVAFGIAKD